MKRLLLILLLLITSQEIVCQENPNEKEIMAQLPPKFLYKILSFHLWQATENRKTVTLSGEDHDFIHLATDEQIEKVADKYWADVPEYVILKILSEKLEGELRLEANPGGTTKYYHLYQGHIPFEAIVESKIVYQRKSQSHTSSPCDSHDASLLNVVQVGNPVLRQISRQLSKEEILSPQIQRLIQEMKVSMKRSSGIGLAAPQIGLPLQLIVIEDTNHSHLTKEQLLERERHPVPFHVVINPKLILDEGDKTLFFEGCLSFQGFVGVVPRAKSVRVDCLNEKGESVSIYASGWYARILQHEIDHLNGILYVDRAHLSTLMTEENYVKMWKSKTIQEIISDLQ